MDKYLQAYFEENLEISPALSEWCIENLHQLADTDRQTATERKMSIERTLERKRSELKEVILMKAKGLLVEDEFELASEPLRAEIGQLEDELARIGENGHTELTKAENAFKLGVGIGKIFENGTYLEKKQALAETGSNLTLKDKTPSIHHDELHSLLIKGLNVAKAENSQFEPRNIIDTSSRNKVFAEVCPTLLRG